MKFNSAHISNLQYGEIAIPKYNYFIGKNKFISKVNSYKNLTYRNIYPNIDLSLKIENDKFSYNFVLNPSANQNDINISFIGQDSISLNDNGDLKIKVGDLIITNQKPYSYQFSENTTQKLNSNFKLNKNNLNFNLEARNKNSIAVIDPLVYSTYYGGSGYDYSVALALDKTDRPVIAGYTYSDDFPQTFGVNSRALLKMPDVFVSKFNADCSQLLFSTFIGSTVDDYAQALALDSSDNIYVCGYTGNSNSFPIVGKVFDSTANGGYDAFLFKLDASGDSLIYSTFIGGTKDDYAIGLALDKERNAYITGYTTDSSSYPKIGRDSVFGAINNSNNCFITKIDSNGSSIIYSDLFGGSSDDFAQAIAIDTNNNAFVIGTTFSRNFPAYNSFNNIYSDSLGDYNSEAFICKFTNDGAMLVSSALMGGNDRDGAYALKISDNYLYVCGSTQSNNFPIAGSAYQKKYRDTNISKGIGDIFYAKTNLNLDHLYLSSYFGGTGSDRAFGITVDKNKNILLTGFTGSRDFPTVKYSCDTSFNDSLYIDAFVSKFNPNGDSLIYSTYLGGKSSDVGKAIALDKNEMPVICGFTQSKNYPVSDSAFKKTHNDSTYDAFITKVSGYPFGIEINVTGAKYAQLNNKKYIYACENSPFRIEVKAIGGVGVPKIKFSPNSFLLSDTLFSQTIVAKYNINYRIQVEDQLGVKIFDSLYVQIFPLPKPEIQSDDTLLLLKGVGTYKSKTITNGSTYIWQTSDGNIMGKDTANLVTVQWTKSGNNYLKLKEINAKGCIDSSIMKIYVGFLDAPILTINGDTNFCFGRYTRLDAGAGYYSYKWNNGDTNRVAIIYTSGAYYCTVKDINGLSANSDTVKINVFHKYASPTIVYNSKFLRCLQTAKYYQWYVNNEKIEGDTNPTCVPRKVGAYTLKIFDKDSCAAISNEQYVPTIGVKDEINGIDLSIYPNPFDNSFEIKCSDDTFYKIEIFNVLGESVYASDLNGRNEIFLNNISSGVYLIKITINGVSYFEKVIKN